MMLTARKNPGRESVPSERKTKKRRDEETRKRGTKDEPGKFPLGK